MFRCMQTQITALMKHISCQNYINSIIRSLLRPVVPLAQHCDSHSDSKRCNIGRSRDPNHYLQPVADGAAGSVPPEVSVGAT